MFISLEVQLKVVEELIAKINKEIETLEQNYKKDPEKNAAMLQFLKSMSDDV